jgi:hypothetical protein
MPGQARHDIIFIVTLPHTRCGDPESNFINGEDVFTRR